MKMFEIDKGTPAFRITPKGEIITWIVRKDLCYGDMNIASMPYRYANKGPEDTLDYLGDLGMTLDAIKCVLNKLDRFSLFWEEGTQTGEPHFLLVDDRYCRLMGEDQ
jgi:hypothetical protein